MAAIIYIYWFAEQHAQGLGMNDEDIIGCSLDQKRAAKELREFMNDLPDADAYIENPAQPGRWHLVDHDAETQKFSDDDIVADIISRIAD